jgi:hypothetical protein
MNTIQVTTIQPESNDKITVNYTETEVLGFIKRAREADAIKQTSDDNRKQIETNRYKVRDFFSECEWSDGEALIQKSDVNDLLSSIGANKLTTRYNATYTITGTFSVECEDEDDAETLFTDNVRVDFYDGDIDVDQIEVSDIEEAE